LGVAFLWVIADDLLLALEQGIQREIAGKIDSNVEHCLDDRAP
jgi:hypothetical protein